MMLAITIFKVCDDLLTVICHIIETVVRIEDSSV
jgi:hypothetical protein